MPQTLIVEGKGFELVKTQRIGASVYRGDGTFMRIGPLAAIEKLLKLHRKMDAAAFPVAQIVEEGELDGRHYYIEESLGPKRFGELFADDMVKGGAITSSHLKQFIEIVSQFAEAQSKTALDTEEHHSFRDGIHLEWLCAELPDLAEQIRTRFETVRERLRIFPYVLTHGDFNPANMYPKGVIDLEDSLYAPVGFDIISALTTIDWFPRSDNFEFFAHYDFSPEQRTEYFAALDGVFSKNGLPRVSQCAEDFEFCRAVWLTVRMQAWPRIQKFRYEMLIKKYL